MKVWDGYLRKKLDIKSENLKFYNVKSKPIRVYGLYNPQENYCRMPIDVADKVSGAVSEKNHEPTGGRIRFATDSEVLAIKVKLKEIAPHPTISSLASSGFDVYKVIDGKEEYIRSFMRPIDGVEYYEGEFNTESNYLTEYVIYLPLGNELLDIEIGIKSTAVLKETLGYKYEKPIVFYGSSITQGAGASRPGNIYEGFVSRKLNSDFIALGFSGNAKGESLMAEYIASLNMSAFVLDYDHNAPSVEHLNNTHYAFYAKVREQHPNMPIILISKPDGGYSEFNLARKDIILKTYLRARENGDKNIYFIDGASFFAGEHRNDCTIDGCHPNDLGHSLMANSISDILLYALERVEL